MNGIVAVSKNGVIGSNNSIPWHYAEDLVFFKKITMGSTIIMGYNTWLSIGQKPLPGRKNIVLSRKKHVNKCVSECASECANEYPNKCASEYEDEYPNKVLFCKSLEDLELNDEPVFVIGGSQIYKLLAPYIKTWYVTRIPVEVEGDCLFDESMLNGFVIKEKIELSSECFTEVYV